MSTKRKSKDGLYRRGDSPFWWASFIDSSGKRSRRSTGTAVKKEATAILAQWRLDAFNSKTWGVVPVPLFDEVLFRYLKRRNISPSVKTAARHLSEYLTGTDADAGVDVVRGFIDIHLEERAPATINKMLVLWSASINEYNRDTGTMIPNHVSGQKLSEPEARIRWITREQAQELISAAKLQVDHLAPAVELALFTGMRRSELFSLTWQDVDLQAGLIHLQATKTKSKRSRTIPMTNNVLSIIRSQVHYRARHCPSTEYVLFDDKGRRFLDMKRSYATAKKVAGIENFTWHDMRHTFASWLVKAGVPLDRVRDLLGHSSITQTEKYAHLEPVTLRDAVAHLPELSHDLVTLNNSQSAQGG